MTRATFFITARSGSCGLRYREGGFRSGATLNWRRGPNLSSPSRTDLRCPPSSPFSACSIPSSRSTLQRGCQWSKLWQTPFSQACRKKIPFSTIAESKCASVTKPKLRQKHQLSEGRRKVIARKCMAVCQILPLTRSRAQHQVIMRSVRLSRSDSGGLSDFPFRSGPNRPFF